MAFSDPVKAFPGTILVAVPHMDDEVLACGGTIAQLPQKERIHVVYATDGSKSPHSLFSSLNSATSDLRTIRMAEAKMAMRMLGVSEENVHFLGFPDVQLREHIAPLRQVLVDYLRKIKPSHVLIPFRYDRHPDHLALNRAATEAMQLDDFDAEVVEYFVYYRWRLLAQGDIRKYIKSDDLIKVDTSACSAQKRKALSCFRSQITRFYAWQDRPILTERLLEEVCQSPEYFFVHDPAASGRNIFGNAHTWIRVVHMVEPRLKKGKDHLAELLNWGLAQYGRKST